MSQHNKSIQRQAISKELYLLENQTLNSKICSPKNSLSKSLVNNDIFSHIKRKTAIDQAQMITRHRNRIEVIKRCVQSMKNATYFKDLSLLSNHQKCLIDDKSTDLYIDQISQARITSKTSALGKRSSLQFPTKDSDDRFRKFVFYLIETRIRSNIQILTMKQKFTQFINFSFQPTNLFVVLWNMIMIIVIVHNLFSMPLQDAFSYDFLNIECAYLQKFVQIEFALLIFDIFMQFNIAIMQQGTLVEDKRLIVKQYLTKGFIFDVLGVLGFFINRFDILFVPHCRSQGQQWATIIFKYFFFFKQHRFKKLLGFFKHQLYQSKKIKNYFQLVELLFLVLIMAHYIACYWITVGHLSIEQYPNSSWLTNSMELPGIDIYLQAMYFACMTMTTVGYGDISPKNPYEYIACIAIMLLSCGFFGYILNTINIILGDIKSRKKLYIQELEVLENYMQKSKIQRDLQDRVKNYLKSMHESGLNDDKVKEQAVLNKLNSILQSQLLFQDKGKIFQNVPCISENFTKDFTLRIIDRIKEVRISPGQSININELVSDDQKSQGRFIYVVKGSLEFSFQKSTKMNLSSQMQIFKLQEGEYYGLPFLFGEDSEQAHKFTLKSVDFSVLYTLTGNDIVLSLDQKVENKDKQRYCMIRDKVKMNQDYSYLQLKCQLCGFKDHEINKCSFFFMQPDKKSVISKNLFSKPQIRSSYQRTQFRTYSRSQFLRVQSQAHQFNDEDHDDHDQSVEDEQLDELLEDQLDQLQDILEDGEQEEGQHHMIENYPILEQSQDQIIESDNSIKSWTADDPYNNIPTINDVKSSVEKKKLPAIKLPPQFEKQNKQVTIKMPVRFGSHRSRSPQTTPDQSPVASDFSGASPLKPKINLRQVIRKIALVVPWITKKKNNNNTNLNIPPYVPSIQNITSIQNVTNKHSTTIQRESRLIVDNFATRIQTRKSETLRIIPDIMDQFERVFQFEVYFAHNNFNKVLQKMNKKRFYSSKKNYQNIKSSAKKKYDQQQYFSKMIQHHLK